MPAARAVTVIPATINLHTHAPSVAARKRRTAGYARVSTDKDDQANSYESQCRYFREYIQRHSGWEFAGIYADGPVIITLNQQTLDTSGVELI